MTVSRRRAGVCVPLFSLRTRESWGIGEIGSLPVFAEWLKSAGQTLLQILPLNELAADETSPYSALSAMAIDPRYISIAAIPEAQGAEEIWRDDLAAARASSTIDYVRVVSLKQRALRMCFDRFMATEWRRETERAAQLARYAAVESWWLDEYALFRALRAQAGERPWTSWSRPLRDRDPEALAKARGDLADEILYFQYVQWIAASQWRAARAAAAPIEILGDFPFMVTLDSADVWSRQHEFLLDASVGTPPDAFSDTGQEWGLPPYNWPAARANDFQWLRSRARRMADLYDGFRVDHLVGFYRTYVRPFGGTPYFSPETQDEQRALGEQILDIVLATGRDVSVEDLGTVPEFVRDSVAGRGLPGYRVLRWEAGDPATYPEVSVAMTGTHDTTTLAEWWETMRAEDRKAFASMPTLAVPDAEQFTPQLRDALLRGMYRSGSATLLLPLQDVFGWRDRINSPATVGDWNWTFALPWPAETAAENPEAAEAARRLRALADETGR